MKSSVALCSYNGIAFIREQLLSIINQTVAIDELVICDDFSTDETVDIIKEIIIEAKFEVKLLLNDKNLGAIRSFEKCLKSCSNEIIFLSDQDDIWFPTKVEKILSYFKKDINALAVFSNGELINGKGEKIHDNLWNKWGFTLEMQNKWQDNNFAFSELFLNRNVITGATLAFKRELLSKLIPFELPPIYWHDAWIGLIAAGLGGLRFINEPTILYRIHHQQQVGTTSGANDKKFDHISYEQFTNKVIELFPKKKHLIHTGYSLISGLSLWKRIMNKIARNA